MEQKMYNTEERRRKEDDDVRNRMVPFDEICPNGRTKSM
jgi:hypothetical protein